MFRNRNEDYTCQHCKRRFLSSDRGGMFHHVNTLDPEKIREIVADCEIMEGEIVKILHQYTLRNLLIDLSKEPLPSKLIKNRMNKFEP